MAFHIKGPTAAVSISDPESPILELPERLELTCPQFARISDQFGQVFEITGADLKRLSTEVFDLLDKFRALKESQLESLGMVNADDPVVRATVFDEIVRRNPVHEQLEALLVCCKEAIQAGVALRCEGS